MANKLPAIGDIRYRTGEENPYKGRSKDIRNTYGGYLTDYKDQQQKLYNQSVAEANKSAENAHRQQYISYMQNRRDLPNMLAQQGMNGGVGETSRLNLTTNYQNNRNATDAQRAAQIQSYRDAMNNNIATFTQANNQAMQDAIDANQDKYNTWQSSDLDKQKQIYSETISGYTDADEIRNEIARIRRSGKDTWRIAYLQAQLGNLEQAGLTGGGSSGSGGSGRSGGYSGGGGGGGDDVPDGSNEPTATGGGFGANSSTFTPAKRGTTTRTPVSRPYQNAPYGANYNQREPYGTGYITPRVPRIRIPKISYGGKRTNSLLRRGGK